MIKHELFRDKKNLLIYILIFSSLFFILFLSSCSVFEFVGLGKVTSEERQVLGIEIISTGSSINVSDNLDVKVNSSGIVKYKGDPNVNPDVSSGGSLKKVGN